MIAIIQKKNFRLFFINSQELFQVENEFQD